MSTSSQLNADPARSRQARYSTFLEGLRSEVDTAQTRLTQVQQRLQVVSDIKRDASVILHPDDNVPVGNVIDVYDISRIAGFDQIQFAIIP
mgnify:CR=1 FL=1